MSSNPSASFSDRQLVRELARRLRPPVVAGGPPEAHGYIRLAAPAAWASAPPPAPVEEPDPEPPMPDNVSGSGGWTTLLEWCVVDLDTDAAFLTDDRGLVIASVGALGSDDAQAIGARMVIAFNQADRIDRSESRSISIELEAEWLTAIRVPLGDEHLTLGVLGREPLSRARRRAVYRAVADKISRF